MSNRKRETGARLTSRSAGTSSRIEQFLATRRSGRRPRRSLPGTRCQALAVARRTRQRRRATPPPPPPQRRTRWEASPSELGADSLTYLGPRSSRILAGQCTSCASLEFRRPRSTDSVGVVVLVPIEARKEVGGELGAAIRWKGQRITQECVGIDGHRVQGTAAAKRGARPGVAWVTRLLGIIEEALYCFAAVQDLSAGRA